MGGEDKVWIRPRHKGHWKGTIAECGNKFLNQNLYQDKWRRGFAPELFTTWLSDFRFSKDISRCQWYISFPFKFVRRKEIAGRMVHPARRVRPSSFPVPVICRKQERHLNEIQPRFSRGPGNTWSLKSPNSTFSG